MQRKGLGACDGSELYFETQHNCTVKCTMGSMARAGSEARPATAAGRWSAAGSVNRSKHCSSGSLLPSASVHYGRTDTFC